MAPKWFDHWTTWTGPLFYVHTTIISVCYCCFSFFTNSGQNLGTSGTGFVKGRMPFLSPSQQCQNTEGNSRHWPQPALTDWVVVLPSTRHKIGHFGDVPDANLLAWYGKTKPNTTKAHIHQSKEMYYDKINTKKLKPDLVASYDIWPGNRDGLFWFLRFINLSLTYLHRHLPTYSPVTHTGDHN